MKREDIFDAKALSFNKGAYQGRTRAKEMARAIDTIMKSLGEITKEAYKEFAQQVGKKPEELTDSERRQAFTNYILENKIDYPLLEPLDYPPTTHNKKQG